MKKFFLSVLAIAALTLTTSCSDDDSEIIDPTDDDTPPTADSTLTGQITEDMTLTPDTIWILDGRVTVTSGTTLTIMPGTILKGLDGTGVDASALLIARGATINADGDADNPIIFTSEADNIEVGQTSGTNLDENDRQLWGGLIVLGNARGSFDGDAESIQIEGIPASDPNGLYGGNDDSESSGILNYISIRHGGISIGSGNEINGLTLGGVGSGTTVSNIEVVANLDDGIEFFGGAVNTSNLLVWAQGDDGLDIDEAYSGTISNSVVILGDISDHALEIDGPAGSFEAGFTINGLTLFGNTTTENGEYADLRDNAQGTINNVYATGFKASSDVELDNNVVAQNFLDGSITFSNWVIDGVNPANSIFAESTGDDESAIILNPDFTTRAADWTTTGTSGGADLSVFGWTFASANGAL